MDETEDETDADADAEAEAEARRLAWAAWRQARDNWRPADAERRPEE